MGPLHHKGGWVPQQEMEVMAENKQNKAAQLLTELQNTQFKRIPLSRLKLTESQRPLVAEKTLALMADKFYPKAFGVLHVGHRKTDPHYYYVDDGQQRSEVVRRLAELSGEDGCDPLVPCIVYESEGAKEEAHIFVLTNGYEHRTGLKEREQFRAAVTAQHKAESGIRRFLKTYGLVVGKSGAPNTLGFARQLVKSWVLDKESCKAAVVAQLEIAGEARTFNCLIHKAFFHVFRSGIVLTSKDLRRVIRYGGPEAIERAINVYRVQHEKKKANRPHTPECGAALREFLGK